MFLDHRLLIQAGKNGDLQVPKSPPELFLDSNIFWAALAPLDWIRRQGHMKMTVHLSLFVFPTPAVASRSHNLNLFNLTQTSPLLPLVN